MCNNRAECVKFFARQEVRRGIGNNVPVIYSMTAVEDW
jgi:hypothetical protein